MSERPRAEEPPPEWARPRATGPEGSGPERAPSDEAWLEEDWLEDGRFEDDRLAEDRLADDWLEDGRFEDDRLAEDRLADDWLEDGRFEDDRLVAGGVDEFADEDPRSDGSRDRGGGTTGERPAGAPRGRRRTGPGRRRWEEDDRDAIGDEPDDDVEREHERGRGGAAERWTVDRDESMRRTDVERARSRGADGRNLRALLGADRGPRWRVGVGAVVVLVLVALAATVLVTALRPGSSSVVEPVATGDGEVLEEGAAEAPAPASADPVGATPSSIVVVHVSGAVQAPGVHELPAGSRVRDAVGAAGGFVDGADEQALNLARPLVDGEQIRVPLLGEALPPQPADPDGGSSLVNLNTATSEELQELPGVGEAIAGRIIAYRDEHGGFTSIDELLQVSGIGEATFAELEPLVTV